MKKSHFMGLTEDGFHSIAYTEWGNPHPTLPPVLCLHGLTRNGRDFDALANQLSEQGRHVFCPDIVGRGDSDWLKNPNNYTFEQYIIDMGMMIARMQSPQIDLVGTSMGGLIGMIMASMPNSPIRRLIMNDIGAQIPVKGISRLAQYAGKDPEFKSLEEANNYFKSVYGDFGQLSETQWLQLTEHSIREIAPGRFQSKLDPQIKRTPTKSRIVWKLLLNPQKIFEGTLFDVDLWGMWRNIVCPVLVIHGVKSDLLLPSIIKKMQETHKETEVLEIMNAGHAPALLEREQIDIITKWLAK